MKVNVRPACTPSIHFSPIGKVPLFNQKRGQPVPAPGKVDKVDDPGIDQLIRNAIRVEVRKSRRHFAHFRHGMDGADRNIGNDTDSPT